MQRLNVQAAIHPTSIASVLVYVDRDDGSVVANLNAYNFRVDFWASDRTSPGDPPALRPAVLFASPETWGGYELAVDNLRYNEDDPSEQWHEALPTGLERVVYVVTVETTEPDAQGRCIVEQADI
jgi:hypothetical protein